MCGQAACCGVESVPGFSSVDFGLCTTPAMFTVRYLVQCRSVLVALSLNGKWHQSCITAGYEYDGALMVTASHLPSNRNGIKFFTPEGM
jgi:hypothetical protein